jgi:hypothetical protein
MEFIIPKFFKGSACFEWHTAHHQELQTVFAASGLYAHALATVGHNLEQIADFPTRVSKK